MNFNPAIYRYPSRRNVVYSSRGMVAASQPLAAQAGLEMLRRGGNAMDAIVAAATCLPVVEASNNGIGGDAFALIWTGGRLYGLNASGYAPEKLSAQLLRSKGMAQVPLRGFEAVTIPGAPSAWAAISSRFGRLPLSTVMEPAVRYAREGFPQSVENAASWASCFLKYRSELKGEQYRSWFDTYAPQGAAPRPGELWCCPQMGDTLQSIAETGGESFYRGELTQRMLDYSARYGGYFTAADFADYQPQWVDPITTHYRGYDVHEIPPNGQGISALMALNILAGFDFDGHREQVEVYHRQIEAMKLAMLSAREFVSDPAAMTRSVEELLSPAYGARLRAKIGPMAHLPQDAKPNQGGTVYLCAADDQGNMVSYIQSNYLHWGSGLVVPDTGIALQNRGYSFSLEEGHVNVLAPRKKPYHTIIPGFLTKDGQAVGPFGVMGGYMQPQGHVQVVTNTIDFGMNPQDALNAPRWQWTGGNQVLLEPEVPLPVVQGLLDRGHQVRIHPHYVDMGKGEIIWRREDGVLCGGAEPRADGTIAAW